MRPEAPTAPEPVVSRRGFLTGTVGGCAAIAVANPAEALQREAHELPPDAVGFLFDSTLCVGCKACVVACKEANGKPAEVPAGFASWNAGTYDAAVDLSGDTLNVIRLYTSGTGATKDVEADGHAFVKRSCLHCVDPSCVSVCPVSAMRKDEKTGIVTYNKDACIGCRYCTYACPFGVPQYQLNDAFGQISKCQMCTHLQKDGKLPACADVCPTGATLFGPVRALDIEADRRRALTPGTVTAFPRGDVTKTLGGDRPSHEAPVASYVDHVYGRTEGGGTQMRYLAGVPFVKLGLPALPAHSGASISEGVQHTLYKGLIAPLLGLAGLLLLAFRSARANARHEAKNHAHPKVEG
jgi:Fe-S-cluster-containing dehydrogenase component